MKKACDEYFYLPHRSEHRGVGGLFFDDLNSGNFGEDFRTGKVYRIFVSTRIFSNLQPTSKYVLWKKRENFSFIGEVDMQSSIFLHDRGTKYGIQSGRRIESVLSSMPPLASWVYNFPVEEESQERSLTEYYLIPRDWVKTH